VHESVERRKSKAQNVKCFAHDEDSPCQAFLTSLSSL
jgi:hypothetical protein